MRRVLLLFLLILIAFLMACGTGKVDLQQPEATAEPTAVATAEPIDFVLVETPTPVPVTPTPSPEPTPTPDPYTGGMEMTVIREGFYYVDLNDHLKERISGLSYPSNPKSCLVPYEDLRYLRILYYDFSGEEHVGELIVHRELAEDVLEIFSELYDIRYPLTSVRLVDDFGEKADDTKSMEADNTSSFCYRKVTGEEKLSRHSYGAAIDINPRENPYIRKDGTVSPSNSEPYVDRSKTFDGKIDKKDMCYKIFIKHGWNWGGDFKKEKDYQHFSKEIETEY